MLKSDEGIDTINNLSDFDRRCLEAELVRVTQSIPAKTYYNDADIQRILKDPKNTTEEYQRATDELKEKIPLLSINEDLLADYYENQISELYNGIPQSERERLRPNIAQSRKDCTSEAYKQICAYLASLIPYEV